MPVTRNKVLVLVVTMLSAGMSATYADDDDVMVMGMKFIPSVDMPADVVAIAPPAGSNSYTAWLSTVGSKTSLLSPLL